MRDSKPWCSRFCACTDGEASAGKPEVSSHCSGYGTIRRSEFWSIFAIKGLESKFNHNLENC